MLKVRQNLFLPQNRLSPIFCIFLSMTFLSSNSIYVRNPSSNFKVRYPCVPTAYTSLQHPIYFQSPNSKTELALNFNCFPQPYYSKFKYRILYWLSGLDSGVTLPPGLSSVIIQLSQILFKKCTFSLKSIITLYIRRIQ